MVRTSGERRLSEFLTWQLCESGAQLEFLPVLWPDFGLQHFLPILLRYQVKRMNLSGSRCFPI
jgi:ditrans,polycis-polyprenyl diphosphate synthase